MNVRTLAAISFGAGVLAGFVIGQLVAHIHDQKKEALEVENKHISEMEEDFGEFSHEKVKTIVEDEGYETESEKIPEGDFEDQIQISPPIPGTKRVISAEEWAENKGQHWSKVTYIWNKTRELWLDLDGSEADVADIIYAVDVDMVKRLSYHGKLGSVTYVARDDLMMDFRLMVTDEDGMQEILSEPTPGDFV